MSDARDQPAAPIDTPDAARSAGWWAGGFLAEVFAAHPFATICGMLAFLAGGAGGSWLGFLWWGLLGAVGGWAVGAIAGLLIVAILWLVLGAIGFAG